MLWCFLQEILKEALRLLFLKFRLFVQLLWWLVLTFLQKSLLRGQIICNSRGLNREPFKACRAEGPEVKDRGTLMYINPSSEQFHLVVRECHPQIILQNIVGFNPTQKKQLWDLYFDPVCPIKISVHRKKIAV